MRISKKAATLTTLMIFGLCLNINLAFSWEKLQSRYSTNSNNSSPNLLRVRFGAVIGAPPYAFLDKSNRLAGINVDLARRVCLLLTKIPDCEIQAISAGDAESALKNRKIDAMIGAIRPTRENRFEFNFGKSFFPNSFFVVELANKQEVASMGSISGTIPESTQSKLANGKPFVEFKNFASLLKALSTTKISSAVLPSYAAQFWLLSDSAKRCCIFQGPVNLPFLEASPFRFATSKNNIELHNLLEDALYTLETSGSLKELRQRYFPLSSSNQ